MEQQNRPVIKISLTIGDKISEALSVLLLIAYWIFTISNYSNLPEIIPTHFNGHGEVDGYGSKVTLFLLSAIGVLAYVFLTWAARFPHQFNYLNDITEENAKRQYTIAARMLRTIKLCIIIVFFAIDYQTVQTAFGHPIKFGGWFMVGIMSLVLAPVFYFLIQSSKNA